MLTPESIFRIVLPIKTVSEANCRWHYMKKHTFHKKQKEIIALVANQFPTDLPLHIKLTRIAPGTLDKHDNLPCSMKYVYDAICGVITPGLRPGFADDNELISVSYDQSRGKLGEYSVMIEFFKP